MLQQTRVETVKPYFARWMRQFPTIATLAGASERRILLLWEGLGYYSRARNLHRAAKIVVSVHGGQLPQDRQALLKLPGIGKYTAAAIRSIAFGHDDPTLDGNARRVLARVFNVQAFADSPEGESILEKLAARHLPTGKGGAFNQALMDLGATVCLPKSPHCDVCPVRQLCRARRLAIQAKLPVLAKRGRLPHRHVGAAVIVRRGRVLIAQRPPSGLLGGMWEFPNAGLVRLAGRSGQGLAAALGNAYGIRVRARGALTSITHAYSHFQVTVLAYRCDMISATKKPGLRWARLNELAEYPMGKVDRRIAEVLLQPNNSAG